MTRRLLLYEDAKWRGLRPLTDLTPVPALVFGAARIAERWLRATKLPLLAIEGRPGVLAAWGDAPPVAAGTPDPHDEVLVINAAAVPGPWLDAVLEGREPALFVDEERIAGARLPLAMVQPGFGRGEAFEETLTRAGLPHVAVDALFLTHPWDLIEANADAIGDDLATLHAEVRGEVHRLTALEGSDRIRIEAGAVLEAFVTLDARGGPIWIGPGVRVASHTHVEGPCVIGAETQLLGGVVVRSSIGPQCRIAGEVEESVWQGYANKRHHGFVGHSAIGEWVNLGALTTTSDLKNNYGTIRVFVDGAEIDSGRPKIGALIGAHAKTGIGTLLPTGASVGVGANLFGGGRFAPKHVPSFGWWDGERMAEHDRDRFLATARTVMGRRGRAMLPADAALLHSLFEHTASERR
jgi:UDP-N-acetylglucosamine diphosphorylase/glucosamine-1-phosphate N-acetyltransferase